MDEDVLGFADVVYRVVFATAIFLSGGVILMIVTKFIREKAKRKQKNFVILQSIDADYVSGEISFSFEVFYNRKAKLYLTDFDSNELKVIEEKEYKEGIYRVKFDTTEFENGTYFYCLKTDNQNLAKKIKIRNN